MDQGKLDLGKRVKRPSNMTKSIAGESKDKGFSVKTTQTIFNDFTRINRYYGMSNNSVLNQLIVKYIRDNKNILDELNEDL